MAEGKGKVGGGEGEVTRVENKVERGKSRVRRGESTVRRGKRTRFMLPVNLNKILQHSGRPGQNHLQIEVKC